MKHLLTALIATLIFANSNYAQYTTVNYDVNRNWFNEGQPLPAEKAMVFKGIMPENTEMAELNILSAKRGDFLFNATVTAPSNKEFSMPVNYKLRASDKYDFRIDFFRPLPNGNKSKIEEQITATLNAYVDLNLTGDKSIKLVKKGKHAIKEMNEIVTNGFARYRVKTADWQPQLSEVIKLKLEQLEKTDLDKSYVKGDSTTTKKSVREATRQTLVNELKAQIKREINQMLEPEFLVISESRMVNDYETENKENGLSVNVGYGGVYLSGKFEDANYGAAPYAGMAFPLGNSVLGSKFLSNSSVTLGFFFDNFEDENGNEVTGFLVNRPIYAGLDHKLFKFIHINAGATFLETLKMKDGTVANPEFDKKVLVRPFVGLSVRFNLSIGLGK